MHDDSSQSGSRSINSPRRERGDLAGHITGGTTSGSEELLNHGGDSLERRGVHPGAQQAQQQDEFNYTYYKLSYDTSQQQLAALQLREAQNANDNDYDNVSHDSYHLREESADELEQSGDELDRSTGDELDRSTGDELDSAGDELDKMSADEAEALAEDEVESARDKVYDTVLHIDEEKLMREVREEMLMREEQEEEEEEAAAEGVDGLEVAQSEPLVQVEPPRVPGLQETSIDDVMSPVLHAEQAQKEAGALEDAETQVRKVEVEIVEREQEKVYNRTPSVEKPLPYNFSRSESEGNESTANERVNDKEALTTGDPTAVANGNQVNGNEIQYVLHRRQVEKQQQANGRPSRPLQKQHTVPAKQKQATRQQKVSRDQARLQLEQIKTDLRTPIVPPSKRSPRDKSPGSGLVRVKKLPPRDSYSYQDDTVSPSSAKEIITYQMYDRSPSTEDRQRRPMSLSPQKEKMQQPILETVQAVQQSRVEAAPPAQRVPPPQPAQKPVSQKPATSQKPTVPAKPTQEAASGVVRTHKAYPPQNDLNKPSPPKKPPRTSSNVEHEQEAQQLKLAELHKQNLTPPKAPKAEIEDLTPTTDTDSDSSGGAGRRKGGGAQPHRGHVVHPSQLEADAQRILQDGGEAAESASLVSSHSSHGAKTPTPATSPVKKVESPVCEESFSAMKGQDLPFADSVPHFSDEDDEEPAGGVSAGLEEDLEEQLNVPGLEQEEFSDAEEPPKRSPVRKPAQRSEDAPPPVPTCPPPESDISSDSEPEKPTDEGLPEIVSVPGVTSLPPPVASFFVAEDDDEGDYDMTVQSGPTATQYSPMEPRKITAIPEEPGEHRSSVSSDITSEPAAVSAPPPPPGSPFKYVRSDSDVPPPPPPVELLEASALREQSSPEGGGGGVLPPPLIPTSTEVSTESGVGVGVVPPPVAPTEISSGSDVSDGVVRDDDDEVDLDAALASSSRIVGQVLAAEYTMATGQPPGASAGGAAPGPQHDISSEEEVNYPDEEAHEMLGDLQEALREGRTFIPPSHPPPAPMDLSSGSESDPAEARGGDSLLPEMDQFEKRFELHIEEGEDDEGVQCLVEGAEHLIAPLEGTESLSRTSGSLGSGSGVGAGSAVGGSGRRSSGSSSGESGAVLGGAVPGGVGPSTAGLPLQISSESDVEGPVVEDLPDPTDILESNVLANPYMVPGDEFSEQVQELPSPPHPPGLASSPTGGASFPPGVPQVQETIAHHSSIIDQYYVTSAGSMQTSGPSGARPPPSVPPKPQHPLKTPPKPGYQSLQGADNDSDDSAGPAVGGHKDEEATDRLEALESLRQPYIVHHSDSSDDGNRPQGESDSESESSSESDDFEEIPEAIIRQRQLGRHHIGIEVSNKRYRSQAHVQVNSAATDGGRQQQQQQTHHIYENVASARESSSDGTHIYQNLRAVNEGDSSGGAGPQEGAYQVLRPREARSQQQPEGGAAPSQQGQVFSNPYAESFGAQVSSRTATAPSVEESSRSAQGQRSSGRSGRASQSDSSD